MATIVPISGGGALRAEPVMTWRTQGMVMMLFSVVVFFGQLFSIVVASAVAKAANDGSHVAVEGALKAFILALIPSLVGRVVAGAAWAFGRIESSDEKKGSRTVALFETLWGNVVLLVLSAISTFTTAVLLGALSPKWSVLYESRTIDSTNNLKFLVGATIALAAVCAVEMLYSHGKFFVRSDISSVASTANATLISMLMFVLGVLMIASLGINAYYVFSVKAARDLTAVAAYAADGAVLKPALDRLLVVSALGLAANAATAVLYALKGCVKWFDTAILARIFKLTTSSVAIFTAAAAFGGTLPKLTYIGILEPKGKAIFDKSSNPLFMVTALSATNFAVLFGVVAIAHIMAFARAKL